MHPKKMRRLQTGETAAGYLFVSPMLLGVGLFTFIPLLALFGLGFTDWNFVKGLSGLDFVGLKHFRNLLHDSVFQKSLMNNVTFMLVVPITMCLSLSLAILINKLVYLKDLFKLIYFMPFISSSVAVAIVFQVLFHPTKGPVNSMLKSLGVANPPMWLADIQFALPSIMMISIWVAIGFNMIIYMAGLQTIPHDLYEAADLDGATGWQKLVRITIPLLSPTSFPCWLPELSAPSRCSTPLLF